MTDVLFLAQLPPPVHGQSAMAKAMHDTLGADLGCRVTRRWSGGAESNEDVGRRSLRKYLGFAGMLARLAASAVAGRRYDIAYLGLAPWAHTAPRDALLAGMARLVARRTWIHLHGEGLDGLLAGDGMRPRLMRWLLAGTELLAVTEAGAQVARRSGVFARVASLPNLAADPGPPPARDRSGLVVSCLCNLDPRKGVLDFVEAVGAAVRRGIPLRAIIAGGGTAALGVEELRRHVAARGLSGIVCVVGRVDEAGRARLLADTDVFLYPSRHDLAPLAVIEALAHGCAPLVLDTGGLREMLGPTLAGNVLEAGLEGPALGEAVAERLAAYRARGDLLAADRAAARRRFLENYSPRAFGARVGDLLESGRVERRAWPSRRSEKGI